ncbi:MULTISPECIES: maleylacetoacetate isomerase [unclassified Arsukibacterium]|uniref:maleylacetoacetate isomerase n=1 Tax=unclassified Arsukibacterium TaxID=2635278 RepID=UPI000C8C02B0|nr:MULTISPECIES: maleylacetoacetate isomerase [unclassified Arsukibacterium]MAA94036.1 maleylacetoacetate isomerase [Rheinheimera sp.]HAW93824.1 maleylacetoacetate isomerase [Candidatus Azambacteria bacterium]|tara:strand:- start:59281 stop:59922 length:642 start_codon:yes stop_codon:yes gene_type:complete
MKLYSYWRSSAAYRVRIALNLKQLSFETIPVHLLKDGGQQHSAQYQQLNPNQLVPTYVDGELTLNQSLAIIEYLEEMYPEPALLPEDAAAKAQVRSLALDIACDIHPLNNLRVLQYLTGPLTLTDDQKTEWIHHWLHTGFTALEQRLLRTSGEFCYGDSITLADVCLVPQVYNALRFKLDTLEYPTISRLYHHCQQLAGFALAAPEQQSDAQV